MRNIRGSCLRIVSTAILDGGYYLFILQRWAGCYAVAAELESSLERQFFFAAISLGPIASQQILWEYLVIGPGTGIRTRLHREQHLSGLTNTREGFVSSRRWSALDVGTDRQFRPRLFPNNSSRCGNGDDRLLRRILSLMSYTALG